MCRLAKSSFYKYTRREQLNTAHTSDSCIEDIQQRVTDGYTVQKWANEAAQVKEPYLYNCSPLGTNTVLKSESQHFLQLCLPYLQDFRCSSAVVSQDRDAEVHRGCTVVVHYCTVARQPDSSPIWTKTTHQAVTCNEFLGDLKYSQCQGYICRMMRKLLSWK